MDAPRRYPMQLAGPGNPFGAKGPELSSAEELAQVLGVAHRVVRVAVVEDRVHLAGLFPHVTQVGDPGLELARLVEIAEFLRGADPLLLPRVPVAPVEANHPQRRRYRHDGRHAGDKALRLIDDDIGEAMVLEESDDALTSLLFQPGDLAEFDRDPEVRQPLPEVFHESVGRL